MKHTTRICLIVVFSVVLCLALLTVSQLVTNDPAPPPITTPTTATTTAPSEPPSTTASPTPLPQEAAALLAAQGLDEADLAVVGCTQLVTVDSTAGVQIRFYEYAGGWFECEALRTSGFVGMNGVAVNRREGSGTTPVGLYGIGEAFYIHTPPVTALPSFAITADTYWVDDPYSAYYNQRVEGTANKDWTSAEHMIDYPDNYQYGFVVEYNTAGVFGAGSAIFFHVGDNPTAGCIATSESMVLNYLAVLDPACNPYILIG